MYTNTPDGHFLVGSLASRPNVVLLGGFSGHGFKFAPIMGDIAADLAVDGYTPHPIDGFSPGRFARAEKKRSGAK
jgi:sarcosine oxidase